MQGIFFSVQPPAESLSAADPMVLEPSGEGLLCRRERSIVQLTPLTLIIAAVMGGSIAVSLVDGAIFCLRMRLPLRPRTPPCDRSPTSAAESAAAENQGRSGMNRCNSLPPCNVSCLCIYCTCYFATRIHKLIQPLRLQSYELRSILKLDDTKICKFLENGHFYGIWYHYGAKFHENMPFSGNLVPRMFLYFKLVPEWLLREWRGMMCRTHSELEKLLQHIENLTINNLCEAGMVRDAAGIRSGSKAAAELRIVLNFYVAATPRWTTRQFKYHCSEIAAVSQTESKACTSFGFFGQQKASRRKLSRIGTWIDGKPSQWWWRAKRVTNTQYQIVSENL
ncbi:hypothetical protein B0H14DRAFT_2559803 [Mycena olivaceomarginata]|nr:hypothetical protein B0H14DRAFT_2559803 [Mycena olivaceomarginata]